MDDSIQPRPRLDREAVRRYALTYSITPEAMPPITLGRLKCGTLLLIDGFHRLDAAKQASIWSLPATVVDTTLEEARWLAVQANIAHGVPLRGAQKREAFRRFVRAGKHLTKKGTPMSSRLLARTLPLATHQTMLNWMRDDFPKVHAEMVGEDPEEIETESGTLVDADRERAIDNLAWARRQYAMALKKATKHVPSGELAADLRDTFGRLEKTMGRPLVTLEEALDVIHGRQPEEDF